jgi:hypothetical protein
VDLQVLEPQQRAGADDHGRVLGKGIDLAVELQLQLCGDRAVLVLERHHVLDHADPDPTHADVVAGGQ